MIIKEINYLTFKKKNETLFDGTLGKWIGKPYKIELKENEKHGMHGHMQYQKYMNLHLNKK